MLLTPSDAETLLRRSIVDSFDSILSYSNLEETCNIDKIDEWFEKYSFENVEIEIHKSSNKVTIDNEERKKWLQLGYKEFTDYILKKNRKESLNEKQFTNYDRNGLYKNVKICFYKEGYHDEEFAIVTHHKNNTVINSKLPQLTLGVVIKRDENYYLCIQQSCDSVRIPEGESRNFLFLKLSEEGEFPIVLIDPQEVYKTLKVECKYRNLHIIEYDQTVNGTVQANEEDGGYIFKDINDNSYTWILDLKESHAQRILNKFASEISRVGLDESEWLRRWKG
ncbi:MAG: hypothetical protein K9G58_12850 [Bacteroidales bacterium]|nr:hypothetical protein [Bacteroidales bacterium]MCF8387945.1 hypothetical protein [Bacteroidales bacterium]MCF8399056.1 hypothetical protein [Bacteroidales bacterium]